MEHDTQSTSQAGDSGSVQDAQAASGATAGATHEAQSSLPAAAGGTQHAQPTSQAASGTTLGSRQEPESLSPAATGPEPDLQSTSRTSRDSCFKIGLFQQVHSMYQYGFRDEPDGFGIVVNGKCLTCKGHKPCSHVRKHSADSSVKHEKVNYFDCRDQGWWGSMKPDDFETVVGQHVDPSRQHLKLWCKSSKKIPFHLLEAYVKEASKEDIHVPRQFDPNQTHFHDSVPVGYVLKDIQEEGVFFHMHGVTLNVKVRRNLLAPCVTLF